MSIQPSRVAFASVVLSGALAAQGVERLSVSSGGVLADFGASTVTRPTDDGRWVAFTSQASNLVLPDVAGTNDVYLRDRLTGTTTRVRSNGIAVDVTPDGRLLSYTHFPGLIGAVVDLVSDVETALSAAPLRSTGGRFSSDGGYLLYMRGDDAGGGVREAWRRELSSATDDLVSATFSGPPNTAMAFPGHLSAGGFVATFTTVDPNIVPGDLNAKNDAFYKDYGFGFTDRYSVDGFGGELPQDSNAGAVTPDTRYFLFTSMAAAVPEDTNGTWDLYVADRFLGELRRASVSSSGEQGNASTPTLNAWISDDGSRVIYDSFASNLVAGDTNGVSDVFEHDFTTGTTRRLVFGLGGAQPDGSLDLRGVSSDGRYLTVLSDATNLVGGPQDGQIHAYLVDLGPQCYVASYCSALPNSTGQSAVIQATGTPSFTTNTFVLSALSLPPSANCTFFHGTTRVDPPTSFGNGLRCAGGTLVRLGTTTAANGVTIQYQDLAGAPYAGVQPGDVRRFQLVYRDPAAGGAGFNTTAALEITFCP